MRTKARANIVAWRAESLIRDLAVGDKTAAELAEIHDVAEQTVWDFKMRHKADIAAVLEDWSGQFDHIWSTRKENRIRALTERYEEYQELIAGLYEDAHRATEQLRNMDPSLVDEGEVSIDLDKFRSIDIQQRKILREICEELGQLPSRNPADTQAAGNPITEFDVLVEDADGNLHAVQQPR